MGFPWKMTARRLASDRRGNFAVMFALALVPIGLAISVSLDYTTQRNEQNQLQQIVDAAVLAGAREDKKQVDVAKAYLAAELTGLGYDPSDFVTTFDYSDDVLKGAARSTIPMTFGGAFLKGPMEIGVVSKALAAVEDDELPCINVLDNKTQAALFNSGAKIIAPQCEVHIHSTQNPAMIANSGVNINTDRICLKGTKYINNGGQLKNLEAGCNVRADPYFQKIPEPAVPGTCTTSGAKDGTNHTLAPGKHCGTIFNGSPKITFQPGLHIISGSMIINANSEIVATGVTFYFPDSSSKIQFNGGITMEATAPTSGTYKNILMFEKTTDAANNNNKQPFVFNGSVSEKLSGLVYLPNRDVTYNSTTNHDANDVQYYFNTLIVNSANWKFTQMGNTSIVSSGTKTVRLID